MIRMFPAQFQHRQSFRQGFTLVEMMVSVALVVVLMLAITQIFSITSKTMGGGQAIAAALRDAQAAQSVMAQDIGNASPDGACFIIRNVRKAVPRNATDLQTITTLSEQNILTEDLDGNGFDSNDLRYEGTQTYSPIEYNHRNHRIDYLMFFASNVFPRVTGGYTPSSPNDPTVSEMSGRDAAIFYHHLSLPTNTGSFTFTDGGTKDTYPGEGSSPSLNSNNFFANQWILGRVAMLMVDSNAGGGAVVDRNGVSQGFYAITPPPSFSPIYRPTKTNAINPVTGSLFTLEAARFDLFNVGLFKYRKYFSDYLATLPPGSPWWNDTQMCNPRFQATPYISIATDPSSAPTAAQKNSISLAKTTPIFLPACSQFMVEFAGDFITQNWDPNGNGTPDEAAERGDYRYGRYVSDIPDGRIDTVYSQTGATSGIYVGNIRWYGLPRDTNNNGLISANDGDVVPVRVITQNRMAFEKSSPTVVPANFLTTPDDPAKVPDPGTNYMSSASLGANPLTANPEYTVAWGPAEMADAKIGKPKLLRITIAIDRPEAEGKLPDGQVFEYVFKVGQ